MPAEFNTAAAGEHVSGGQSLMQAALLDCWSDAKYLQINRKGRSWKQAGATSCTGLHLDGNRISQGNKAEGLSDLASCQEGWCVYIRSLPYSPRQGHTWHGCYPCRREHA
jgi:hypothetical protein